MGIMSGVPINIIKAELEKELLLVDKWLSLNRIKLNASKSNFIIFSYRKNMKIGSLHLGENLLEQVEKTKFLGVHIDEHLNFRYHIDQIMNKVSRSIGLLFKLNHFLPKDVLHTLYNSLILLWHKVLVQSTY